MIKLFHFIDFLRVTPIEQEICIYYDLKNTDCILYAGTIQDLYKEPEKIKEYILANNNFIRCMRTNNNVIELFIL